MAASSTKGVEIYISKGSTTPTTITYTAITKAKPAVVSATVTGVNDGDVVYISGTGLNQLDGKYFVVANKGASDFELAGSDTTGATAAGTGGKIEQYTQGDLVKLCLSSLSINADSPSVISTATYCNPSASVPSQVVSAGTLDFGAYVDKASADYLQLLEAEADGKARVMRIDLPNQGYLVAPVTVSSLSWDIPIDGAISVAGTMVLGSKFQHRF